MARGPHPLDASEKHLDLYPGSRALVPWTLTACVMGLVFGLLYVITGEVLAPIAAHAVINHENLHFLLANDLKVPRGRRDDRTVATG